VIEWPEQKSLQCVATAHLGVVRCCSNCVTQNCFFASGRWNYLPTNDKECPSCPFLCIPSLFHLLLVLISSSSIAELRYTGTGNVLEHSTVVISCEKETCKHSITLHIDFKTLLLIKTIRISLSYSYSIITLLASDPSTSLQSSEKTQCAPLPVSRLLSHRSHLS
jgi:hypothetical protein